MYAAVRLALAWRSAGAAPLHAQDPAADFPSRPLRQIVPFAPGGGVDIVTRIVAAKWSEVLGRPIAVENRAGRGRQLGADIAAKAAPDGYTLFTPRSRPTASARRCTTACRTTTSAISRRSP
jgi:tripartite-type tricarboxylate transporter receptor subunit TctC